jgi:hypothetical protein
MPLDITDAELDQLRRRAGIATTPAYAELNPPALTIQLSPADLNALIAALEQIDRVRELIPMRQLLSRLKQYAGRREAPSPEVENPYHQSAVFRSR